MAVMETLQSKPKTANAPKGGGGATLDSRSFEFHCKLYE